MTAPGPLHAPVALTGADVTDTPESVLEFWFGHDLDSPDVVAGRARLWFAGDRSFDETIRERFAHLPALAESGELDAWRRAERSCLALVLVLDQFPRNLYRGHARCYECDPLALEIATAALERGFDAELAPLEASFLYLPLEHAEDVAAQRRSVEFFARLTERAPAGQGEQFESFLAYAVRHRDVVERFGRFPHRNALLGRESTAEELAYLEAGGDTFGG